MGLGAQKEPRGVPIQAVHRGGIEGLRSLEPVMHGIGPARSAMNRQSGRLVDNQHGVVSEEDIQSSVGWWSIDTHGVVWRMLHCASRNACASRNQPLPGDVWAHTRASVVLLAHQYQGAGLARVAVEAHIREQRTMGRRFMERLRKFLAKRE